MVTKRAGPYLSVSISGHATLGYNVILDSQFFIAPRDTTGLLEEFVLGSLEAVPLLFNLDP